MTDEAKRKLIQRWIGAPQTGNLNDPKTVAELLKDVSGLEAYLIDKNQKPAKPDSQIPLFTLKEHTTPNKGSVIEPKGVVFHHSAGSFAGSLDWVLRSESQVSYHVLIEENGTRHNIVPLTRRAWHAGKSSFQGRRSCNGFMIGFAFSGSTYQRSLTQAELDSAVDFVMTHKDEFGWTFEWMTDHRTVSPGRKDDLNPVEWARLQEALKKAF